MRRTGLTLLVTLAVGITLGGLGARGLDAQQQGLKRTMLMKKELIGIEGREVYMAVAEVAPSLASGWHYHDGHELLFVIEGSGVLEIEGQPPIAFKAGDALHVDAGRRHNARNTGGTLSKVVTVHLIEKGKPLAVVATK